MKLVLASLSVWVEVATIREASNPITKELAYDVVRAFGALKYFPADLETRTAIMALVMSMCATEQEAIWLRERVYAEWDDWRGPHELRALFCRRFRNQNSSANVSIHVAQIKRPILVRLQLGGKGKAGDRAKATGPCVKTMTVAYNWSAFFSAPAHGVAG